MVIECSFEGRHCRWWAAKTISFCCCNRTRTFSAFHIGTHLKNQCSLCSYCQEAIYIADEVSEYGYIVVHLDIRIHANG